MNEVAWTAIGILAATVLGNLYWLGSRIDGLGQRIDGLGSRIDELGDRVDSRIDALNLRFDAHIERHAS